MTQELPLEHEMSLHDSAKELAEEFAGTFSPETVEHVVRSAYNQLYAGARLREFVPLLAWRFARQNLVAAAKLENMTENDTPAVLFLCVHNAGRSQMALGWFHHLAGDQAMAWCGGSEPSHKVNPAAIEAMAEVGIDISGEYPKPWTDDIVRAADVVVTMGCGDACPVFPGKRYEDWTLEDPAGRDVASVRPIRDEIEARVRNLLAEMDITPVS